MSFQPEVTEGKVRSMTTTAIITAMESEYDSVRKLYDFDENGDYPRAHVYGRNILLVKAGIGKVNAALAAQKACDAGADLVISTGLAGGIDTSLRQGDIVLAEKVCYHDVWCGEPNQRGQVQGLPLYFEPRPEMMEKIIAAVPSGYFKRGLTVTGDRFLTDARRLQTIKGEFPEALAVDMESAAVAQACYLNVRRPFLSLRIISDVVGTRNQEEEYRMFWQNVPEKAAAMVDIVLRALAEE